MTKSDFLNVTDIFFSLNGPEGNINILENISLSLKEGEFASLVGPSGSGKTSLIMLIAGLERPNSGEIYINNKAIHTLDETALTQLRAEYIGIVFQHFHLVPTMTALENVMLPLEFLQKDSFDTIEVKAKAILDSVGLNDRMRHFPAQLSGGEQQRVALARAFVNSPALLLADEPTGNLDENNSKHILALIRDLQKQFGTTVLFITHDHEIKNQSDRVLSLHHGKIENVEITK